MNVVGHLNSNSDELVESAKFVYVSVPLGQLSSTQLNVLAFACGKYLKQNHIEISPNLNIKFGENTQVYRKALFDYFIKYGLFVIGADASISHDESDTKLNASDRIFIVDLPNRHFTITQLRGLAKMMRSEAIQDIHLINETEFLFNCNTSGRIDSITQSMNNLKFRLRDIL